MSESEYPFQCQNESCGKSLYGPVAYCPYCGKDFQPNTEPSPKPDKKSPSLRRESDEQHEPEKNIKPQIEATDNRTSGGRRWITAILVVMVTGLLAGVAFYFLRGTESEDRTDIASPASLGGSAPSPPSTGSEPTARAVREVAQETLEAGKALALAVHDHAKWEETLEGARKLAEINPRHKSKVESNEKQVAAMREIRDEKLLAYFNKIMELRRYSPNKVNNFIEELQKNARTTEERAVVELLGNQTILLRENPNVDPPILLNDFANRFKKTTN